MKNLGPCLILASLATVDLYAADAAPVRVAGRTAAEYVTQLDSDDMVVRRRAAQALGRFGGTAAADLVRALRHRDPDVRTWAARGLARTVEPAGWSEEARRVGISALREALADRHAAVRIAAASSLITQGLTEPALPVLVAELNSPIAAARVEAMTALLAAGPAAATAREAIEAAQDVPEQGDYVTRLARRILSAP
ncbi:MAG: HEAT repeat domain-containing protein [Pirellulales bacterium]